MAFDETALERKINDLVGKTREKVGKLGLGQEYDPANTRNKNLTDGSIPLNQGANLDDSYSIINGKPVSNRNAIYNDYTEAEMGQFRSDLYDETFYTDDNGYKYLLDSKGAKHYLNDQNVEDSYLYEGFNKEQDLIKPGAGKYGVRERYTPGLAYEEGKTKNPNYGYAHGPRGIDENNAYQNWNLPRSMVSKAEAIGLGNQGNIENKAFYDDGSLESILARRALGPGASEYRKYQEGRPVYGGVNKPGGTRSIFDEQGFKHSETVDNIADVKYKPFELMTDFEKILYEKQKREDNYIEPERDGYGGQLVDLAQASFGRQAAGTVDAVATAIGRATGDEEAWSNVKLPFLDKRIDTYKDIDYSDKEFGVNLDRRNKTNAENHKASEDIKKVYEDPSFDNIVSALGGLATIGLNAPETFSSSAAESLSLANPYAFAAMIATRTNNDREKFMKNNPGKEWTALEEMGSAASNAAVMIMEKAFFKAFGKDASNAVLNPMKRKMAGAIGVGAVKVLKSAGMEGLQEYLDQAQQDLMTMAQNDTDFLERGMKALTSDEAIEGAIVGFGSGGGLTAGTQALSAAKRLPGDAAGVIDRRRNNKELQNIDKHLDDIDKDFTALNIDTEGESAQENLRILKEARDEVSNAQNSKNDTFTELESSENEIIKSFIGDMKEKIVDNSTGDIETNTPEVSNFILGQASFPNAKLGEIEKRLGLESGDLKKGDIAGNKKVIDKALENRNIFESEVKGLPKATKLRLYDEVIPESSKKDTGKNLERLLERNVAKGEQESKNLVKDSEKAKKVFNKTRSGPKDNSEVNLDTKLDDKPSWGNVLKLVLGGGKKKNALDELAKYTTRSLEEKRKTANDELGKLIDKTLEDRASARKKANLGIGPDTGSKDYVPVLKEEKLGKDKFSTISALKSILGRDRFRNREEVGHTEDLINRALKEGHINEKQAKILKDRLGKVAKKTDHELAKQEKEARESKKSAEEHTKNVNENKAEPQEKGRKYKFKSDEPGGRTKSHTGEIIYDDQNNGKFHVEAEIDGEKEVIIFGNKLGNQIPEINKKVKYHSGEEYTDDIDESRKTKDSDKDSLDESTDKLDLDNENTNEDESSSEASRRANLGLFANQIDIENFTDEELDDMINNKELIALFDC